uniref:EF-hand domain-containing protein n=2 Tax=Quercus lobata TaxID=97700 RepID=A0A7N2L012_QUELO
MENRPSVNNGSSCLMCFWFGNPLLTIFGVITRKFWSRFWCSFQSQLNFENSNVWPEDKNPGSELSQLQPTCADCSSEKKDDESLSRGDVETIMKRLGICCSPEDDELQVRFSSKELSELFDEKEPSLEEVKEAFDVFDENRDGFIDARELQRVLRNLGLKEGEELHNCEKMIRAFNENGDGRIDFNGFVKFMEKCLS